MLKFDLKKMEKIYKMDYNHFNEFLPYNSQKDYYFKDNHSSILAVAHLDTVIKCSHFKLLSMPHKDLLFSPVHDDRLGAYLLLDYLPKLGISYDILLTNNEEKGQSTAQYFTEKNYNWMFQFDRASDDVVLYDYETHQLKEILRNSNFTVGIGSYSDICSLDHLNCSGFNFGTCYYNQHTLDSFADLSELYLQIDKFKSFYSQYKNSPFPYSPSPFDYTLNHYYDDDNDFPCSICGDYIDTDSILSYDTKRLVEYYKICPLCLGDN